jgi:hypothetical protein
MRNVIRHPIAALLQRRGKRVIPDRRTRRLATARGA